MLDIRFPNRVIFSVDASELLHEVLVDFPRPLMVITGANKSRFIHLFEELEGCVLVESIEGEPTIDQARKLSLRAQANQIRSVVAIGGGSAIDMAKAIAALTTNTKDIFHYLEVIGDGSPLTVAPLPICAIPTTSGTGAEMTKNAVLCSPEHKRKVSLRHEALLPRIALIDPRLTYNSPKNLTFSCGLDALTQVIEPYISCKSNFYSDAFATTAIPLGLESLVTLSKNECADAREKLSWMSVAGGTALANSGLGIVHGIAGVLGGWTNISHGLICGALLPHALMVNETYCKSTRFESRFNQLRVMIASQLKVEPSIAFESFTDWVNEQLEEFPNQFRLNAQEIEKVAEEALVSSSTRANPITLPKEAVIHIIKSAGQTPQSLDINTL